MALLDPLRHCLKDKDPYVRKTAAICVAKLYVQDPKTVERQGFISMLTDLLADPNPTVVANAVAALMELSERSDTIVLHLNTTLANRLISALEESSEYTDVFFMGVILLIVMDVDGRKSIFSTAFYSLSLKRPRRLN
jgi:vesicle coat complex subunit